MSRRAPPRRAASRAAHLAWAAVLSGCAPRAPASSALHDRPPRAALLDTEWRPPAQPSADTAAAVLTLREPPSPSAVRAVVRAYFEALRAESLREVARISSPDAILRTSRGGRRALSSALEARFARLDHSGLRADSAARTARVSAEPPGPPGGAAPHVRVEVTIPPAAEGGPPLLGPAIVLLLEAEGSGYKIIEVEEDFDLP